MMNLSASLGSGHVYINDYTVTVTEITDGYRLTVTKGSDVQTVDLLGLSDEELETIRTAEEGRAAAELLRVAAENGRVSAEAARVIAEAAREATIGKLVNVAATAHDNAVGAAATATVTQTANSTSFDFGIPKANVNYATFEIATSDMHLYMSHSDDYQGAGFSLGDDGILRAVIT